MKRKPLLIGITLLAVAGGAAVVILSGAFEHSAQAADPRLAAPLVKIVESTRPENAERAFTGVVAARVQSDLGFRVPGKIVERMVNVGEQVKAGQPLMRIDETDLRLVLSAKNSAVAAARAVVVQATADEKRYAVLVKKELAATPQQYEQAKAALDTATAQLNAAQAEAKVAENGATYSVLQANVDGTMVETLGEPGQVVAAGQTVVRLAQAGSREAVVSLPETIRPAIGSVANATVYGDSGQFSTARLRQISDAADARTRTYEARYVLEGEAAAAPLGATVTIRIASSGAQSEAAVPVGAVLDDGSRTGVWILDRNSSTVHFKPVQIERLGEEVAVVSGLQAGEPVVALGAHLLQDGTSVRTNVDDVKAANQ
ncbi:efflux RND transporter periplasmic adaptor subunit [Mesorhizobium cantuariense]|uniref:Efflux RND transporter periplasmic adaptor subunit n=1 Tax=Mesorhizobium cantuariense TaxID=1300275 RepID=A0ABV7MIS8_9HYPH